MFNKRMLTMLRLHLKDLTGPFIALAVYYFLMLANQVLSVRTWDGTYTLYATSCAYVLLGIPLIAPFIIAGNKTKHFKKYTALGLTKKDFFKSTLLFAVILAILTPLIMYFVMVVEKQLFSALGARYFLEFSFEDHIRNYGIAFTLLIVFEYMFNVFIIILGFKVMYLVATYFFDKYAWFFGMLIYVFSGFFLFIVFLALIYVGAENFLVRTIVWTMDFILPRPYNSISEHLIYTASMLGISTILTYFYYKIVCRTRL